MSSDSRALDWYRQNSFSLGEHLQGAAHFEYGGPIHYENHIDDSKTTSYLEDWYDGPILETSESSYGSQ